MYGNTDRLMNSFVLLKALILQGFRGLL